MPFHACDVPASPPHNPSATVEVHFYHFKCKLVSLIHSKNNNRNPYNFLNYLLRVMAAEGEEPVIVSLKSLNSDVVTNVTFVNKTRRKARAWWLDFRGDPVSYGDIGPDDRLRMTTYLTHPWIFRDTDTGAKLLVNMREIYFPEPNNDEDGCLVSHDVIITTPVYLLQDCCLMLIRKLVKQKDYRKLEIPESLRKDLSIAPSLEKELQQYNK